MSEELKKCPFCGGKVSKSHGILGVPFYLFKCQNSQCGSTVSFNNDKANHNPEAAIDNWNRRVIE